ncbi:MAG: RNA polymerase sigma-70 factor [Bacteroidales bacterium]|nr:RNA polymerase sigma-70 factor [Bacteroidales bacterium]
MKDKQNWKHLNPDSKFLVNRLKRGEEAAYEMLFKEYYQMLTVFANRYIQDLETSKELVQDLFVSLYEKRNSLEINSSLKSYLFRSVHNRCINMINAKKIRDKYAEYVNANMNLSENSLEEEVYLSEMQQAIYTAISELPPKCRKIFKMNRFEGLSNNDIAEQLSLSKRTVETQISKALKILRVKLEPYIAISN